LFLIFSLMDLHPAFMNKQTTLQFINGHGGYIIGLFYRTYNILKFWSHRPQDLLNNLAFSQSFTMCCHLICYSKGSCKKSSTDSLSFMQSISKSRLKDCNVWPCSSLDTSFSWIPKCLLRSCVQESSQELNDWWIGRDNSSPSGLSICYLKLLSVVLV
jgi:hypothetical protein